MKIGFNLPLRRSNILTLLYKIKEPSYFLFYYSYIQN